MKYAISGVPCLTAGLGHPNINHPTGGGIAASVTTITDYKRVSTPKNYKIDFAADYIGSVSLLNMRSKSPFLN